MSNSLIKNSVAASGGGAWTKGTATGQDWRNVRFENCESTTQGGAMDVGISGVYVLDDLVRHERADYDRALLDANEPDADVDLDMRVRLVDGDAVLADTSVDGSFLDACARFEAHVAAKYPQPQPSA